MHPGQTFDIDYSVTQMLPLTRDKHTLLQVGLVGYGQYQTTATIQPSGIGADVRYKVNAIGATAGVVLPERKVSVNVKYLQRVLERINRRRTIAANRSGSDVLKIGCGAT